MDSEYPSATKLQYADLVPGVVSGKSECLAAEAT